MSASDLSDIRLTHVFRNGGTFDASKLRRARNYDGADWYHEPDGGFWCSVDRSWEHWLVSEEPELVQSETCAVELRADARVLVVCDEQTHREALDVSSHPTPADLRHCYGDYDRMIDWGGLVDAGVDAILVTYVKCSGPYPTWDVDSLVVLKPDAIESVVDTGRMALDEMDVARAQEAMCIERGILKDLQDHGREWGSFAVSARESAQRRHDAYAKMLASSPRIGPLVGPRQARRIPEPVGETEMSMVCQRSF